MANPRFFHSLQRNLLSFSMLFFLCGCAIQTVSGPPVSTGTELVNIHSVQLGMSPEEVAKAIGPGLTIGYEKKDPQQGFTPLVMKQPLRQEKLQGPSGEWDIQYYYTQLKKSDGIITDDELTPFVFQDGHLVGQGWTYLNHVKSNL